jgi:hypothetical protein
MKNVIKKSCHGTNYSIPESLTNMFAHMDENMENADYGSDEEQTAIDVFLSHFVEYEKVTA